MTNGASPVDALGGDDLVCVTGRPPGTFVGTGADRYIGSSARDTVLAGAGNLSFGHLQGDTETDVVDTGPRGPEGDLVVSGKPGAPNSDRVVMGSGRLQWVGLATPAAVDSVHNLTFRNIRSFRLVAEGRAPRQLTYVGGPDRDVLHVATATFPHDAGAGRHDSIDLIITDHRREEGRCRPRHGTSPDRDVLPRLDGGPGQDTAVGRANTSTRRCRHRSSSPVPRRPGHLPGRDDAQLRGRGTTSVTAGRMVL